MTWQTRLRLWGGVLGVLLVVTVLTLVVNQRSRQAFTTNAGVEATQYPVGSDYGGVVVDQYVEVGDRVAAGDRLFTLSSLALQKDVSQGLDPSSTEGYTIDVDTGEVTYLATVDGTLTQLTAVAGGFVGGGAGMAEITASGSQFVTARLQLSPKDYGRIALGGQAEVELPSRDRVPGTVRRISVETGDGVAYTTVELTVPALTGSRLTAFNQPGSPVSVTLTLRDDGLLAGPTDTLMDFLHRVGVR